MQDSDSLANRLIIQMTIMALQWRSALGELSAENSDRASERLPMAERDRDFVIAVLKPLAAEITERQVLGGPYSLLRSQSDWHDAPLCVDGLRRGVWLLTAGTARGCESSLISGKIAPVEILARIPEQLQEHAVQKLIRKQNSSNGVNAGGTLARSSAVPPWQ
mgnify:CR=1 FL=1